MNTQTITLTVPADLYSRLKQSADASRRSIEGELLELLTFALVDHTIPGDLTAAVASLSTLDDAQLWQVARGKLTADATQELESLHIRLQSGGLAENERERARELEGLFERIVLLRSEAAVILKQRGHDVSSLVAR